MSSCPQDVLLSDSEEKWRQKAASLSTKTRNLSRQMLAPKLKSTDMHNSMVPLHIYINVMQIYHYVLYLQMLPSSIVYSGLVPLLIVTLTK